MVAAIFISPSYVLWTVFLWPAIVTLLFMSLIKWRFSLSQKSLLHFGFAAFMAQLVVIVLLMNVLQNSAPFIDKLPAALQYPIVWTIPIVIAALVTICSLGYFASLSAAIHFSLFFGLLLAAYSGALTTLPEKTVNRLGLGAYEAEIIMLDPAFCDRDLGELGIAEDCTLRNVHVVWSFGDAILLRPSLDEARHVQIPTEFVRSIVQSARRGK